MQRGHFDGTHTRFQGSPSWSLIPPSPPRVLLLLRQLPNGGAAGGLTVWSSKNVLLSNNTFTVGQGHGT